MEHDAWFFIGIFVFIFIIWIATGGPLNPVPVSAPTFAKPSIFANSSIGLPQAPFGIGNSNVRLPEPPEWGNSSSGGTYYGNTPSSYPTNTAPEPVGGIAFGAPSPFRGIVSMNRYVSNASSSNPGSEYVQLSVAQNAGAPINISGWRIVSEATGKWAAIPKGTVIPTSGIVNRTSPILLKPGERAALISGRSPIGTSFRENKCTGYLSTFQPFYPALPQNCPVPSAELAQYYGGYSIRDPKCIEYVNTLGRCQAALFPPRTLTSACKTFVNEHLNYNGCVRTHQTDPDFNGTTWHIYLGQNKHLWRDRYEVIKLLDDSGKTVDAFTY